jgi:hypothetical protein
MSAGSPRPRRYAALIGKAIGRTVDGEGDYSFRIDVRDTDKDDSSGMTASSFGSAAGRVITAAVFAAAVQALATALYDSLGRLPSSFGRTGARGNLVGRQPGRSLHAATEVEERDKGGRVVDALLAPAARAQGLDVGIVDRGSALVSASAYSSRARVFSSRSYVRHVVANSRLSCSSPVRRRTAAVWSPSQGAPFTWPLTTTASISRCRRVNGEDLRSCKRL